MSATGVKANEKIVTHKNQPLSSQRRKDEVPIRSPSPPKRGSIRDFVAL